MPEDQYTPRRKALRRIYPQRADEDDPTWEARVGLYNSTEIPEIPDIPTLTQLQTAQRQRWGAYNGATARAEENSQLNPT